MKLSKKGEISDVLPIIILLIVVWIVDRMAFPVNNSFIHGVKVNEEQYLKWKDKPDAEVLSDPEYIELREKNYRDCLDRNISVVCDDFK